MDHIKKRSNFERTAKPISFSLRDPDEFRDLAQWDMEIRQLEPGRLKTEVSVWAGKGLSILDLSFDKAVHQVGVSKSGILAFGLPDANSLQTWLNGSPSQTAIMRFGGREQFEGVGASTFSGLTFSLDLSYAERIADESGLDISELLENSDRSFMGETGQNHATLQRRARQHIRMRSKPFSDDVEDDLVLTLLEMLVSPDAWREKRKEKNRNLAAKRASAYMRDHLTDNVSIARICTEIGVSACTLRRAFHDVYGIGPKQYFLRAKLNMARAELIKNDPNQTVSDIANNLGYWHLGQFAKDYRMFFSELPTQTREGL